MASRLVPGLRPALRQLVRPRQLPSRSVRLALPSAPRLQLQPRPFSTTTTSSQQQSKRKEEDEDEDDDPTKHSTNPDGSKKSSYQRFKDMTKTYGSYAILMYLALSAVDYSLSFAFVHAVGVKRLEPYVDKMTYQYRKLRYGEEEAEAMERAHEQEKEKQAKQDAKDEREHKVQPWYNNKQLWAEAALAYPIHKILLLPIRAGLTVAWTPKVVKWLRARGWIGAAGTRRAAQEGRDYVRAQGQRAMDAAKKAKNRASD